MIYLDSAATSYYKPEEVATAVYNAIKTMGNSSRGVNKASLSATRIIFETREKLAKLFNVKNSSQIAFMQNSTEALNVAVNGIFTGKEHIITTEAEHNSVLRPLYNLKKKGLELTILKCDKNGECDFSEIEKNIKDNTKAFICTHASNLTGNIMDIKKAGEICKKNNIIFVVDASQTAGVIPVDVIENNIDILCFTGHKSLMGPQGTGGIYVKEGIELIQTKVGGSGTHTYEKDHPSEMPERLEAGTLNGHGIAGLNAALDFLEKTGIDNIHKKEMELMWKFYEGIRDIKGIRIYGKFYEGEKRVNRAPIVTINLNNIDSSEICDILDSEYSIVTRCGGHCAPLMHKALGTDKTGAVRFSFSYFNSEKDIEEAVKAVKEISEYDF
ncbi:aminotransferase class V-fold PLP-dependent enzyme [Pseudoleptotrichia goodfellowii]|uniref:cysteine desulfurase n=1 Tax=Pseudoleptotrichia goodfellowii TaxID=157692 RepID=A0A510JCH8_9FUSO|nr:aminotransferase class V-fold PLP-dependent enzyme [Pseudoleptotrichia goodfellowii]BBM35915.1 cysteine desulfurase family protein [Pseudoleptotrichia goodfellowii]